MRDDLNWFKASIVISLVLMLAATGSSNYLVNSGDWKDVYSASFHAQEQNETPYFVRSNNLGVFNVLPYGEEVNIVESTNNQFVSNLDSQAESQGYTVGDVVKVDQGNLELAPEDGGIVVVPQDYPSAAVVAAPYARATDSWVMIANRDNIDQIEEAASEAPKSVMIGDFGRELDKSLSDDVDEKIISPNKFELSVKVAEKYIEEEKPRRVMITSGDYISRGITKGENPVLLGGTNYLPDEIREFLLENPEHNISTAILIGNEMTTVGKEIRDYNVTRGNSTTKEKISVFVKYGQARGDSDSIYAITLFPLPTGETELHIPRTTYNPETGELFITYANMGESRMYQLTSFKILSSGETVATGGDQSPVFVGGETNRTVSYQVNLTAEEYNDAKVEFSTTHGSSPQRLDTYLTEEGQFSPPLRRNMTVEEIDDNSNMTIADIEYVTGLDRFRVVVKNMENDPGYAQLRITDVTVRGQEESFASEEKKIPADGSETFYISSKLDEVDLSQNEKVKTILSYGEEEGSLVNVKDATRKLETVQVSWTQAAVGVMLLLLVLSAIIYRRSDLEIEISR